MGDVVGYAPGLWALLALGAVLVGFSKTAVGGAATVAVALFASVLPARPSTGVALLLLMTGDLVGVWTYRRDADMRILAGLVLPVVAGVGVGVAFLAYAPPGWLRPVIGAIVVAMCLVEVWRRVGASRLAGRATEQGVPPPAPASLTRPRGAGRGYGVLAGFTTMVANAGGPVMTLYLLRSGAGVRRFLGTTAWFFWAVNLFKLPFSLSLGLVEVRYMPLIVSLVPLVLVGAVIGRVVITRLSRTVFEWTVLLASALSGLYLLFG